MKFDVVKGNQSIVTNQGDGLYSVIYVHPLTQQAMSTNNLTYEQLLEHPFVDKATLAYIKR